MSDRTEPLFPPYFWSIEESPFFKVLVDLFQRAVAALRARSDLASGVILAALAFPPAFPFFRK
jgi:hypothetical protein